MSVKALDATIAFVGECEDGVPDPGGHTHDEEGHLALCVQFEDSAPGPQSQAFVTREGSQ